MPERLRVRPTGLGPRLVLALTGVFVLLVLVGPLAALVLQAARHAPALAAALSTPEALHALGLSLGLAAVALALNGVGGVAGGIALSRGRFPGRGLVDALVDLPLAISPVMVGLAFFLLLGRQGALGPLLDRLGVQVAFAWPGLGLATVFVTLPFTAREVALLLDELGDQEEQAAATLGASAWQSFWWITLPKLRGGLEVGLVLTLARALGEFGAVLVIGGGISRRTQTATTFIHAAIEERDMAGAYGMALLLGAASVGLLALLRARRGAGAER